tara:strand:+ start:262 stop:480 length:219 start_codon:yes stop_codon:yes gene_type:complete
LFGQGGTSKSFLSGYNDEGYKGGSNQVESANGPAPPEYTYTYEIDFIPSGNTPDIDLGAPTYDPNLAERRRK